jgi:SulP family sulfate permease
MNRFTPASWRADLKGGFSAAAVALPLGLAFGVVSGAGPVAGLYCAIFTGLFAAIFGGTPAQIAGPTGPIAIVMASVFLQFSDQPAAAMGIVMLAGLVQISFGALHLGRYISLIPYPVISGFGSGVGCIIIVMQFNPLLGQPSVTDTVTAVRVLPESIGSANLWALGAASLSFAACHLVPRKLRSIFPAELIVLIGGTLLIAATGIQVPLLEAPLTLFPTPSWPPLMSLPWQNMWVAALALALISSLDSLVTSMAADTASQKFHNADQELVGQGIGNLVASLLGTIPGAGSMSRTMANIRAGGISPLSGIFHSLFLLALLLGAGDLIQFIPSALLAGILVHIGIQSIDWTYIKRFPYAPRSGVLIMLVVWVLAVFINVVTAVAVGVVMASLALVKRMADLELESVALTTDEDAGVRLTKEEHDSLTNSGDATLLINLGGPLTFGAANGLMKRLGDIGRHKSVVLDLSEVPHIDDSTAFAFENIIRKAQNNDQHVILVGLRRPVIRVLVRTGLLPLIRQCVRFRRRLDGLNYARKIASN